jgi:hypothetical protein
MYGYRSELRMLYSVLAAYVTQIPAGGKPLKHRHERVYLHLEEYGMISSVRSIL